MCLFYKQVQMLACPREGANSLVKCRKKMVLLLLGDCDTTGKLKQYNEEWSKITAYPLHLIRNAAHFSNGDNPDQVNMEIEAFIQGL